EAQRRRDVAEALGRLGRDLATTLDASRIGEIVTRGVVELLGARTSVLYRYEPEDGTLHSIAWFGARTEMLQGLVLAPAEGATGRAVAERKMVVSTNYWDDPRVRLTPANRERLMALGSPATVAVPLLTPERVVGAVAVGAEAGREFTDEELESLQMFADRAALALENGRLYSTARESLALFRQSQAQLVQAGKMSALGQLVSGVAHELNNPLSVIIGYGQLMLGRPLAPELRRPVELMVSQGERMAKIVRNLLLFARQRKPERKGVDMNEVVEQTLALRLNQLTLSEITVEKEFADSLPVVAGDAQQLQQVILNLLLNAEQALIDIGRAGRIIFRTQPLNPERGVRVQVIDDGPGIPADALPRIFEPFFTTKEVGEGTGLGLSVSYGIAEEHGGRLFAESQPGRTVFTLELPAGGVDAVVTGVPEGRPRVSFAGRTALIVDDEPDLVDLLSQLLGSGGWSVDVAPNGQAGIARVRRRRYDLIVSDMRMPHGSGADFFTQAVAHDAAVAGRFIFVTGDTANPGAWAFAREAGVPVIEKPFQPAVFLDAVRRVALAAGPPA
ncbi:MAG: ATP-binding protein, partial [Candidatus Rokuibacteriota bacterium]